ncbi:MAG TPA: GNAT family N-acetyltransferase [Candidatus Baltobacteraceae bacterium]|jgi:GNAT superfamily N-acetyltransferase|nr:GNAT family N-acetyltransferase [Candidatus Baltobacteraceae bacterium]
MRPPSSELGTAVREALQSDAARIAALAGQLGYEVPVAHVERQIGRINDERTVFVAVVPRAGVVGWIGVALREAVIDSARADIEGLVVEDEYRGNGIGQLLVEAAETWARRRGCTSMRLVSNVVRERAHEFYERLGYDVLKTQHAFKKTL